MNLKTILSFKKFVKEPMEEKKVTAQPWVAVIRPSRGLIFAEVEEYFEQVRDTYPNMRTFRSHDLPIPQCFNDLVQQALQDSKYDYFWFSEDDTIPEALALDKFLIAMKTADISAMDYGFNGGWNTIVKSATTNEILFTGFGCTFMKRKVLESFTDPIFKADKAFNISNMQWYDIDPHKAYGMYDIRFGSEAREKGFTFAQIEGECRHLQLLELGQKEINNGCHLIGEKDRIARHLTLPLNNL